jgi:hypothetical protein
MTGNSTEFRQGCVSKISRDLYHFISLLRIGKLFLVPGKVQPVCAVHVITVDFSKN